MFEFPNSWWHESISWHILALFQQNKPTQHGMARPGILGGFQLLPQVMDFLARFGVTNPTKHHQKASPSTLLYHTSAVNIQFFTYIHLEKLA